MSHSLDLRNLRKYYGETIAVDDVSLRVGPGEFLTFLGPSGSGKTTILMSIAGFVEPSSGDILLDGRVITHEPPEKRNFGMVFQGYALFPHLTVAGNVGFPLRVRGRGKEKCRSSVKAALDLVQMGHLASRMPQQLSGGQQQRVALARALSFEPDLLLLDEPLSALDKNLRAELQWELKSLHQRVGTTFIYVTHDQEEALSMSDRIAIVRDGKIVQDGASRELYERPATRFVADFLGKSNFIRGKVGPAIRADAFTYVVEGALFIQSVGCGTISQGDEVLVALRPEKIAISPNRPDQQENAIPGRIRDFSYFGANLHFLVKTEILGEMAVTTSAWNCVVEPVTEQAVWLSWHPDASVLVIDD